MHKVLVADERKPDKIDYRRWMEPLLWSEIECGRGELEEIVELIAPKAEKLQARLFCE